MSVTHIAGAKFTVKAGATPTDYSAQVTDGSISRAANVTKTKTLGPNTVATQTDRDDTVTANFLFDESSGFYKALFDATESLASIAVEITSPGSKWTGTMAVSSLSTEFAAEGVSTCSATLEGLLAFAANP
jgi:Phage tail tube protein